MKPLQIVCDANIPAAQAAFGRFGNVRLLPGHAIDRAAVEEADVLLVRSVTPITEALVAGTRVRFVGTATAGVDHVDQDALARLGVAFAYAPGSNATSVVEYVLAALLEIGATFDWGLEGVTLGVVGAGQVGGRLVPRARALGMTVVVCDPPRAAAGFTDHDYRPLQELLEASSAVTLHTPLTDAGRWPTRGMIGAETLAAMPEGAILINAARGEVVDGAALLAASSRLSALVLDCWPGEPAPDPALVAAAYFRTPHIAGYSREGKLNGTVMLEEALRSWLESDGQAVPSQWPGPPLTVQAPIDTGRPWTDWTPPLIDGPRSQWLSAIQERAYSIRADSDRFDDAMQSTGDDPSARAAAFAELRRTYPKRYENAAFTVRGAVPEALRRAVVEGLGMGLATGA